MYEGQCDVSNKTTHFERTLVTTCPFTKIDWEFGGTTRPDMEIYRLPAMFGKWFVSISLKKAAIVFPKNRKRGSR